ncbi:uncharacterized protein LOC110640551 [Hevea brasiliensis]|uniref:uncharacterized protein LOC110640551 n=1 Tax=Hevea brasiliensis TaxID=3981 RepID=UPI0025F2DA66|nr:uncharacterized protein LOC110640551 [Hevea brasiliensis]
MAERHQLNQARGSLACFQKNSFLSLRSRNALFDSLLFITSVEEEYEATEGEVLLDNEDNDGWRVSHWKPKGNLLAMKHGNGTESRFPVSETFPTRKRTDRAVSENIENRKRVSQQKRKKKKKKKKESTFNSSPVGSVAAQKKKQQQQPPKGERRRRQLFDLQTRAQLDAEIARMFYTGGLPFNFARNPYYVSSYSFAANHVLGGYVPPGYNKLRTTLLQQEKANVERLLKPIKSTWLEKGVSIVSDGWSDPQRRPLINFMVVSESGPMFIKSVDCSGEVKDKQFIANLLKEVIDEVGHQKVVQVITDNASNCKGAGEIIEGMFPHIYWTPCVVHTLNLALKNICAAKNLETNQETYDVCHWITEIHGDALQIKNFIMNHSMRLAIYNRFSPLKLLSVADTRFASIVVMLKRFKLIRRALEAMVMSNQWAQYREDDQSKARFVRDKVVDEDWWEKVDYIIAFTGPIYDMIRVCDTEKPCLHLVYELWDSMIEKVKQVIFDHEGKQADGFYSEKWLQEGEGRVPPHMDGEVSTERIKCFRRIFSNEDERIRANDEFVNFSLKSGPFADPDSIGSMYVTDPRKWWAYFGSNAPLLQRLAFKVLGQPTFSSCCERNWSIYSFIHSCRRNKLTPKRAEDLVFIHNNLRLLSRNSSQYYDEKTKLWDVGGDQFGSMEDVGVLEFANLSLDEPELESVLFDENATTSMEKENEKDSEVEEMS